MRVAGTTRSTDRRSRTLKSQRPHPGKGEAFEIEMSCGDRLHPPQAMKTPQASSWNPVPATIPACLERSAPRAPPIVPLWPCGKGPRTMFADELRCAIEAADRITLPSVTALLWRAFGEGRVSEDEAEALSGLIEARTDAPALRRLPQAARATSGATEAHTGRSTPQDPQSSARRPGVGSRPRTDASMERRRRWAASGRLPPGLAARFTLAEQAVLSLVAAETVRRKDCRLSVPNLAAVVGVAETTVRNAIREARKLGLLTVEERQITGCRNDTNIVRIISPEWTAWLRLARTRDPLSKLGSPALAAAAQGGGCKSANRTPTEVLILSESGKTEPKKGCREAASDLDRSARAGIRAGRRAGRAMR